MTADSVLDPIALRPVLSDGLLFSGIPNKFAANELQLHICAIFQSFFLRTSYIHHYIS